MTIPDPIDRILAQGRALVRAIEALGTIEPNSLQRYAARTTKRRGRASTTGGADGAVTQHVDEKVLT